MLSIRIYPATRIQRSGWSTRTAHTIVMRPAAATCAICLHACAQGAQGLSQATRNMHVQAILHPVMTQQLSTNKCTGCMQEQLSQSPDRAAYHGKSNTETLLTAVCHSALCMPGKLWVHACIERHQVKMYRVTIRCRG